MAQHQIGRSSRWMGLGIGAAALIGAAGAVGVAWNAGASAARYSMPAPVIATFELERVFAGLEERTTLEADLKAYGESLQRDLDAQVNKAKDLDGKATAMAAGPEKEAVIAQSVEAQLQARVKKELAEALLEQRRARTFTSLYAKIDAAVRKIADQNKYTLVLSSDEKVGVPVNANTQDIQRVVSLKRVMFVNSAHDVTSDVITLMNNEFAASGGKPASAAPASTPK